MSVRVGDSQCVLPLAASGHNGQYDLMLMMIMNKVAGWLAGRPTTTTTQASPDQTVAAWSASGSCKSKEAHARPAWQPGSQTGGWTDERRARTERGCKRERKPLVSRAAQSLSHCLISCTLIRKSRPASQPARGRVALKQLFISHSSRRPASSQPVAGSNRKKSTTTALALATMESDVDDDLSSPLHPPLPQAEACGSGSRSARYSRQLTRSFTSRPRFIRQRRLRPGRGSSSGRQPVDWPSQTGGGLGLPRPLSVQRRISQPASQPVRR